uniref:Uncharacterized protein n=1 Tax=Helianthus annuus TaxID=4232 RepID=A0A251RNM7_HELAN
MVFIIYTCSDLCQSCRNPYFGYYIIRIYIYKIYMCPTKGCKFYLPRIQATRFFSFLIRLTRFLPKLHLAC